MRRFILLAGLLIPTLRSAVYPVKHRDELQFFAEWNDFAKPMSEYMTGANDGILNYPKLKEALRAWRRLERDQEWDQIR